MMSISLTAFAETPQKVCEALAQRIDTLSSQVAELEAIEIQLDREVENSTKGSSTWNQSRMRLFEVQGKLSDTRKNLMSLSTIPICD